MTKTLSKEDQKLLDQAVQEVSTGMLATKVLVAAQEAAGEQGDVDRAYIKLRFRQLRQESAKQLRKVQRLRDQAVVLADRPKETRIRSRSSKSGSDQSNSNSVVDEDGIRAGRRPNGKSKMSGIVLAIFAIAFFAAVGMALYSAF